mmetsp:Transcript_128603/g.222172  ORF Transcript_128603/g.222172 Transcript_128603/m.222172 type:complete len:234 (-) Transcript_128603:1223-1924(-)
MAVKVKATLQVVSDWKGFAQTVQSTICKREDRIRTMKAWFEQRYPQEMKLYQKDFGNIKEEEYDEGTTDTDDVLEHLAAAHGGSRAAAQESVHAALAAEDGDFEETAQKAQAAGKSQDEIKAQIERKLALRQAAAENNHEKEILILKAQHQEEIQWMIDAGKSEEEIQALKMEQAFEINLRNEIQYEHTNYLHEKAEQARSMISFKMMVKIKSLAKKSKCILAQEESSNSSRG